MNCMIISPSESRAFQGIESIILPAVGGEMQVLPGHAESLVKLKEGIVVLVGDKKNTLPVTEGVCYVNKDEITIVT